MTGNEYQKLALRTADTNDRWTLFVNGVLRISEEVVLNLNLNELLEETYILLKKGGKDV